VTYLNNLVIEETTKSLKLYLNKFHMAKEKDKESEGVSNWSHNKLNGTSL